MADGSTNSSRIVIPLARHLDLNSLHDLSRTCRQFRANLLQCRKQLIAQSLRCSKEDDDRSSTLADRLREARLAWRTNGGSSYAGRITSGKVGKCARDFVSYRVERYGNCTANRDKDSRVQVMRDRGLQGEL